MNILSCLSPGWSILTVEAALVEHLCWRLELQADHRFDPWWLLLGQPRWQWLCARQLPVRGYLEHHQNEADGGRETASKEWHEYRARRWWFGWIGRHQRTVQPGKRYRDERGECLCMQLTVTDRLTMIKHQQCPSLVPEWRRSRELCCFQGRCQA